MSFDINEFGKLLKYHPEKSETDVVIPDEVEVIGLGAFEQRSNLNSVLIPEGVVEIGSLAFRDCENLLYIDIPDSVEKIGSDAFRYCYMLERVKLPGSLKYLGRSAFHGCSRRLREIIIPDGVTIIEDNTFLECTSLAHVTLPKNLTEIELAAFDFCKSLKSIEIPEGVTTIGEKAFSASGLARAVIPRSIKTIGDGAFSDTDNLVTSIPIADWRNEWGITKARYALNFMNAYTPDDPFLESLKEENNRGIKDCIYDIELELSPKNDIKALGYLIKEELLEIEDIEFLSEKMSDDLEIVALLLDYKNTHFSDEYMEQWERDNIDKAIGIKEYTYRDWNRIFKLVRANGEYAVKKYRGSDETAVVPGKIEGLPVTSILPYAFECMDNIQSVCIEEGITQIGAGAFYGCVNLTEITLPESLKSIGDQAFFECHHLAEITIPGKVTDIGTMAFCQCQNLVRVTLPDGIKSINRYAFSGTAINEIVIPEGVMIIEEDSFAWCENLSKITLPHSLKIIKGFAFANCGSLKRIVLYGDLCEISPDAFKDITNLTIAAPVGSYAMEFAFEMGYKFEPLAP